MQSPQMRVHCSSGHTGKRATGSKSQALCFREHWQQEPTPVLQRALAARVKPCASEGTVHEGQGRKRKLLHTFLVFTSCIILSITSGFVSSLSADRKSSTVMNPWPSPAPTNRNRKKKPLLYSGYAQGQTPCPYCKIRAYAV